MGGGAAFFSFFPAKLLTTFRGMLEKSRKKKGGVGGRDGTDGRFVQRGNGLAGGVVQRVLFVLIGVL